MASSFLNIIYNFINILEKLFILVQLILHVLVGNAKYCLVDVKMCLTLCVVTTCGKFIETSHSMQEG